MNTITSQYHTIVEHPSFERRMFWGLLCMLMLSISVYGFFLGKTVVTVIERRVAQSEIEKMSSSISSLESEYLSISGTIDMTEALSYGFVEAKKTMYAVRGGEANAFALRP